jgi:hypothetical protein
MRHFSLLNLDLRLLRFVIVEVRSDGNCLPRAIAHQLFGDEKYHLYVRETLVRFMWNHEFYFSERVKVEHHMSFESYMAKAQRDKEYLGELEIEAACGVFMLSDIQVRHSREPKYAMRHIWPAEHASEEEKNVIKLLNSSSASPRGTIHLS